MNVLNGAVGDLNRRHTPQAQLHKELGTQQYGVLGTNVGHHKIGDVRAKLLGAQIQAAARGHHVTNGVARADAVPGAGHVLTEHNLLLVRDLLVIVIVVVGAK